MQYQINSVSGIFWRKVGSQSRAPIAGPDDGECHLDPVAVAERVLIRIPHATRIQWTRAVVASITWNFPFSRQSEED